MVLTRISRALGVLLALGFMAGCSKPDAYAVQFLPSPARAGSAEPHLAQSPDGSVVLSWLEPDGDGVALRFAVLAGDSWTDARTVARGDTWFVNWADFPSVSAISDTLWAAHWLEKRPGGTYAYDVAIALSRDSGQSWDAPITPHTDGTRTEHGFVSLFPWHDGVGALWLDGRNMSEDGHGAVGEPGGGMTLRSAVMTPAADLAHEHLVDELVCDCCQTDIAITAGGPAAVYRNRTSDEIRDIYVARYRDGRWQPGQAVADDGWEISGCPVNGPAIAAEGDTVGVAWFTAANGNPRVRFARSDDAAATFAAAIDVDAERALGRVDVAMLDDSTFVVSWLRRGIEGQGEVAVRRVSADGTLGPAIVIANTTAARSAGFPQMLRRGNDLVFAWTHLADGGTSVRTARLAVDAAAPANQ